MKRRWLFFTILITIIVFCAGVKIVHVMKDAATSRYLSSIHLTPGDVVSPNPYPMNGKDNFSSACFKFFFVLGQSGITAYRVTPKGDPEGPLANYRADQGINVGISPICGCLDPSGKWMYVGCNRNYLGQGSAAIATFKLFASGQIRVLPKNMLITGSRPSGMIFSKNNKHLYVSTDSGIYQYDVVSPGRLSPMKPIQASPDIKGGPIAITPDGKYAYCANAGKNCIYEMQCASNGQLKPLLVDSIPLGKGPAFVQMSANGKYLWCLDEGDGIIERLSIGPDGQLTRLSAATPKIVVQEGSSIPLIGNNPTGFVVTRNGKYAYVARRPYDSVLQFIINPDGTFRENTPYSVQAGGDPTDLRLDPDNKHLVAINVQSKYLSLYSIDSQGRLQFANPSMALGQEYGMSDIVFEPKL